MAELNAIERLKLTKGLRAARADLAQAATPIAKLKVVKVIREIREKLGLGAKAPPAVASIPSKEFKGKVIDAAYSQYGGKKSINEVDGSGYLAATLKHDGRPIFVIDGNLNRDTFKALIAEADSAGIDRSKMVVFGGLATYSGGGIDFHKISELPGLGAIPGTEGAATVTPPATPGPEAVNPHIASLRAVTSGGMDSQGLNALYGTIQEAVNSLNDAGELVGDTVDVANAAITHWAELEIKTYG